MIMFFVLLNKFYIICVLSDCIFASAGDLNLMILAGGLELILEMVGVVRVYKGKK